MPFRFELLLAALLASGLTNLPAFAQSTSANDQPADAPPADAQPADAPPADAPPADAPPANAPPADAPPANAPPAKPATPAPASKSRYRPTKMSPRARNYYETLWGVDSFRVKAVESGEMIRFSYRVLNPGKAAQLNDKRNEPSLLDERAHVRLAVPALEKVGKLRQSSTPEASKAYWMVFSNKERYVKSGDRVSVVIGKFRVDGLLVE